MAHPVLRYLSRWYGWIPFATALVLAIAWGRGARHGRCVAGFGGVGRRCANGGASCRGGGASCWRVFGTTDLALAVTVIEAALVVSMILSGGDGAAAIARDTVYAAVMIVAMGVVGLCLLGGLRHHVLVFASTAPARRCQCWQRWR